MIDDRQLLERYLDERAEDAFAELVARHVNLVYFAALRRTNDTHAAEEICQQVFTILAQGVSSLRRHPALTGWLYTTTRYVATKWLRSERRRQVRQQAAQLMQELVGTEAGPEWDRVRPLIDAALDELGERDRTVVLLRYFEGQSFAAIGAALAITEDAARMRVERALDKLQGLLGRRGIASTAVALAAGLAAEAAAAVPVGFASTVATAALGGGSAVGAAGSVISLLHIMNTTKIAVAAAVTIGVGAGVLTFQQHRTVGELREQIATLQATAAETQRVQADNQRLQTAKAAAEDDARVAQAEVARIRAAIARHRAEAAQAEAAVSGGRGSPSAAASKTDSGMIPLDRLNDMGRASPSDTAQTIAHALQTGDIKRAAEALTFTPADRAKMEAFIATLPAETRAKFSTPEEVVAVAMAGTPKPIEAVEVVSRSQPDSQTEVQQVKWKYASGEVRDVELTFRRGPDGWKQEVSSSTVDRVLAFLGARK